MPPTTGTLKNVAALQGRDRVVNILDEVLGSSPEIRELLGRTITGTGFDVTVSNKNPEGGFRSVNQGVIVEDIDLTVKRVQCARYDNPIVADVAEAEACEDGEEEYLRIRAKAHLKGAFAKLGRTVYYGSGAEGSKEFPGLQYYSALHGLFVNAGGSTADSATSVYLIRNDIEDAVALLFGRGTGLNYGPFSRIPLVDAEGGMYEGFFAALGLWIGMQALNTKSVVRIGNITDQVGKGWTDALTSDAIQLLPAEFRNDKAKLLLLAPGKAVSQLEKSRSALNAVAYKNGALADYPTESRGIRIVETDNISLTEPIVVVE